MKTVGLLFLIVFHLQASAQPADSEGFVLVKSEPRVEVHERWVAYPGKRPAVISRELKSEVIVNASVHKIIHLIKDESQVGLWQTHLRSYKIYLKADTTMWDEYSCHDVPWPLTDQDSFMEYTLKEIVPGAEYHIFFKSRIDMKIAPVQENINRIELTGSWKLVSVSPGMVRVTYRVQSIPATNVPRMIVDPVIRNNLVATIRSLTEIVEK